MQPASTSRRVCFNGHITEAGSSKREAEWVVKNGFLPMAASPLPDCLRNLIDYFIALS
jgi:hypothetical protein